MGTLRRTDMSSKKLVYLFMASIVCGFMVAGTAHGQSSSIFNIEGTIENSDGTPAAGLAVSGERITLTGVEPEQDYNGGRWFLQAPVYRTPHSPSRLRP